MKKNNFLKKGSIFSLAAILISSQIALSVLPLATNAEEILVNSINEKQKEDTQEQYPAPEVPEQKQEDIKVPEVPKQKQEIVPVKPSVTEAPEQKEESSTDNKTQGKVSEIENRAVAPSSAIIVSDSVSLRAALTNSAITSITLANDITLTTNAILAGTTKTIEGNGHNLVLATGVNIASGSANQRLAINNTRLVSNVDRTIRMTHTATSLSLNNVTSENGNTIGRFVALGTNSSLNIFGNVKADGGGFVSGSSFVMTVENGANVVLNNSRTANNQTIYSSTTATLNIRQNATLDVTQNEVSNSAKAILLENTSSQINIETNGKLKVVSSPYGQKVNEAVGLRGSLNVANNATLDLVSASTYSTLNVGGTTTFQDGSNIQIQNNRANGSAIGSYPGTTQYNINSSSGMQTWLRGVNFANRPSFNYANFTRGSFSLNTYTSSMRTSNITSNDAHFISTFSSGGVGKIATGLFVDSDEIQETTINNLTTESTVVTGAAEPNSVVEIRANGSVIGTGVTNGTGVYSISIPRQVVGITVTAQARLNGQVSNTAQTVVREASIPIGAINPDVYSTGSSNITGSYTGDITRVNLLINGRSESWGGSFSNGSFSYYVNPNRINVGDDVVLVAYSADGTELDRRTVTVISGVNGSLWPDEYRLGASTITGSFSGDINFARLVINGVPTNHWGGTFNPSNGIFSFYISPNLISAGDSVTLQGFNSSDLSTVVDEVPVNVAIEGTISPNDYTIGNSTITGSYTGNVARAQLFVNGQSISQGGTFTNGSFSYYVNANLIKANDNVVLMAYSADGRELDSQTVRVIANSQGTITPADYRVGNTHITGTYTGDVARAQLLVNGNQVNIGGSFANGNFTHFVPAGRIQAGDNVVLVALDAAGRELNRQTVRVLTNTQGTITPADYRLGDANIAGTYTGDVVQMHLLVNGNRVNIGGNFANGNFTHFVPAGRIQAGDNVILVAFDATGRELDRRTVRIANTQGTITPTPFRIVQSNSEITGTFTGDVTQARLVVNGTVISTGGNFNQNGTFSYFVRAGVIQLGDTVTLIALDSTGRELQRTNVPIANTQGTITASDYKVGDANITGNYTGDVTSARLVVNGRVVTAGGGSFSNGTFSYFVRAGVIQAGDIVILVAMDANGRELDQTNVRVNPNIQGTITLNNYTAGGANLTGAFTGDIARGRITVNGVVGNWGGTFNPNGTFTYYVGNLGLTAGDRVTLTGFSLDHTELDDSTITVQ